MDVPFPQSIAHQVTVYTTIFCVAKRHFGGASSVNNFGLPSKFDYWNPWHKCKPTQTARSWDTEFLGFRLHYQQTFEEWTLQELAFGTMMCCGNPSHWPDFLGIANPSAVRYGSFLLQESPVWQCWAPQGSLNLSTSVPVMLDITSLLNGLMN